MEFVRIDYFDRPSRSNVPGQQRIITLPPAPAQTATEHPPKRGGASRGGSLDPDEPTTIVHPATVQAQALMPTAAARREVLMGFWDNIPQRADGAEHRPKGTDLPKASRQHLPSRLDSPMFEMGMMLILTLMAILIERIAIYWFTMPL
ncbi:MAG: hypothetical protein IT229_13655 [Flavobacteriales bacterium]|nr:hypothetical protein [Flavobacteriales bacterium]